VDNDRQYSWIIKAISGTDEIQVRPFAMAILPEIGFGGISRSNACSYS